MAAIAAGGAGGNWRIMALASKHPASSKQWRQQP